GRPDKALAKRLLDRYAPKGATALTRKASGLSKEAFARLDADGDGTLDAEELARFALRPPDLELAVRLGARGAKEPTVEAVKGAGAPALARAVRPLKNGGVELVLGNTRITLGGPAPAAGALNIVKFDVRAQYKSQFTTADRDNNGYL